MGYDNMHRITSKKQHLSQTGVQFDGTLNAGYEISYTYGREAVSYTHLDVYKSQGVYIVKAITQDKEYTQKILAR